MEHKTGVVFISPDVTVEKTDGNYCVRANKPMKPGALVLLEHVFMSRKSVTNAVMADNEMFRELWPRSPGDASMRPSPEMQAVASQKSSFNCFYFDDKFVIGNVFSKFNHSCSPNCHMGIADKMSFPKMKSSVHVYAMWVHVTVQAGDELTIDYANGVSSMHDDIRDKFGTNCGCTKSTSGDGERRAKIHMALDTAFRKSNETFIQEMVTMYLTTARGKGAVIAGELARSGIYKSNGDIILDSSSCKCSDSQGIAIEVARVMKRMKKLMDE